VAEPIAVVTGTTSGMGRELVRGLATAGFTVVAHARSAEKAAAEIARLGPLADHVQTVLADLSSRADVRRLGDELAARFPRIDVLIHNAATVPKTRVATPDGLELGFATNVLAPFLLTKRLDASLRAAAPGRVQLFWGGNADVLDVDDLQSTKGRYDSWRAYSQTKNACVALTRELARRGDGGIVYCAVLPGLVNTEGMRGLGNLFSLLGRPFFRTPAQGARTSLWLATEADVTGRSGKCYGSVLGSGWQNEITRLPGAIDPARARRLYEICEELAAG
jgi:NAD(P)-dependent dehydrogenase (short-subunit alcohol dehydrogenase family)